MTLAAYQSALEPFTAPFDAAMLMAEAERLTGLSDWGGKRWGEEQFRHNLHVLCHGVEADAQLSLDGRSRGHSRLHVMLCSRLRYLEARKTVGSLDRQKIVAPLIGTGLPRAGTTFLHGLLSQDPDNMVARSFESAMPAPWPQGAEDRRAETYQEVLAFQGLLDPDVTTIHPTGADMPEECIFLQEGVCGSLYGVYFNSPGYNAAIKGQIAAAYDWQVGVMQYLQTRKSGKRWALKAPGHMYSWGEMLMAFPDACIYLNHRDPGKVIPSIASLFMALRSRFSDAGSDPHSIGVNQLVGWQHAMNALVDWRAGAGAETNLVDVHYATLIKEPLDTVAMLYDRFGIPLTAALRDRMARHLDADHHGKGQKRHYRLADYGLDEGMIEQAFGRYIDHFAVLRERRL